MRAKKLSNYWELLNICTKREHPLEPTTATTAGSEESKSKKKTNEEQPTRKNDIRNYFNKSGTSKSKGQKNKEK